ncbi:MAG: efflux RND transporter periplasmic adaptor subunit [Burkholderiaceae bacterium]|nr:efflux RND transporter periplasmic adaptor subunit [Burkholderiaceae bacterium]
MTPLPLRKILIWTTAAAAAAALVWLTLREPVQLASVAPVTRGPLEQTITEDGKTRLRQRYAVTAPVAGQLQRVSLAAGDRVEAGQVVAVIEPGSAALLDPRARSQALGERDAAEAALQAAGQRVRAAESGAAIAAQELARQQALRAQGMTTASQRDQAQAQADSSTAALASARADELVAQRRLDTARASLAQAGAAARGGGVSVRAPVGGVVVRRHLESATAVAPGQPLLDIGDPTQLEIEADVLSTDAVRLAPGMKARVLRWGGDGVLEAQISRVEPGGFTKVSALGVEEQRTRVVLQFTAPAERRAQLGDAYRVELEFILRQDSDVLQVPGGALFRSGDGWATYVVDGGVARRQAVRIGARSATATQILDGLQAGQQVIVQPDDRIHDGTRIEAVRRP